MAETLASFTTEEPTESLTMKSLVSLFLLFVLLQGHRFAADSSKPNIVFLFADDWGWGDLSCHGHPWLKSPNLDRLARAGIDFQHLNVLHPVCSPSRLAALAGMVPKRS